MAEGETEYAQELRKLTVEAERSDGMRAVELLEEAVRLADAHQDMEGAMAARIQLVRAAVEAEVTERAIVAFTRCLADYDAHRERMNSFTYKLMWYYKWVAGNVYDFAAISMAQIEAIYADMERRYAEWGYNKRGIYHLRLANALALKDPAAREWMLKWRGEPRDKSANCSACEVSLLVKYLIAKGDLEAALRAGEPIFNGRLSCLSVPVSTYCRLLEPLMLAGRAEMVRDFQGRCSGKILRSGSKFENYSCHMHFFALDGKPEAAFELFRRHIGKVLEVRADLTRFEFLAAGMVVCRGMRKAGKERTRVRLPEAVGGRDGAGHDMGALGEWCRGEARKLAETFDARNGHGGMSAKLAAAERLVEPL